MESPWPLALVQKYPPDKKPRTRRFQEWEQKIGRAGWRLKEDIRNHGGRTPKGADRDLGAGRGQQRGDEWMREIAADADTLSGAQC